MTRSEHAGQPDREKQDEQTDHAHHPDDQQKLAIARRFLQDDEIKAASPSLKYDFLRAKGILEPDVRDLLGLQESVPSSHEHGRTQTSSSPAREPDDTTSRPSPRLHESARPPIVTYPEFLARPKRPPPLVTSNGLLSTAYGFAGLAALVYGTSNLFVAPMVESLTEARSVLYASASDKLADLISILEGTVSVHPSAETYPLHGPKRPRDADDDDDHDSSDAGDPTEMFHRNVGTQTSLLASPAPPAAQGLAEKDSAHQAGRLKSMTRSLCELKDILRAQTDDADDARSALGVLKSDADASALDGRYPYVTAFDMYGIARKAEPEDEIRRVRDNIRRIKGLLSTRSFPASTR